MEMGMVGLGRMGGNMVLRLMKRGHRMVAYDRSADAVKEKTSQGAVGAMSVEEFVKSFQSRPRVMWVMVPAGDPTTQAIDQLIAFAFPPPTLGVAKGKVLYADPRRALYRQDVVVRG